MPLVIRFDPMNVTPRTDEHLVANLDLAQTIAEATGVSADGAEGSSLLPLLESPGVPWREDILVEHLEKAGIPTYCAIRNAEYTYVAYETGEIDEEELYDLAADTYQLNNLVAVPEQSDRLIQMRTRVRELCNPSPPGWQFTPAEAP